MFPDVSDEHLVKKAQAGDKQAFLTLYNRYINIVYNRVKSRVPYQEAEDVTQEIFIAVIRSLDSFEQRSQFSTWLYTIVNRQIADFYRRVYRRGEKNEVSLEADDALTVEAETRDMDDKVILQQSLYDLPTHYQEVILMRFADGLTFAEIAAQLGKSLEATKSLYRRAIQMLSDKVGGI